MRIFLIQPWIDYRGAETVALYLSSVLKKKGIEVKIATLYLESKADLRIIDDNSLILPWKIISYLAMKSKFVRFIFSVPVLTYLTLKNAGNYDLICAFNTPASLVGAIAKTILSKKVIWFSQSVPSDMRGEDQLDAIDKITLGLASGKIDHWAVAKTDLIFAISKKVAETIKKVYKRESLVIYPSAPYLNGSVRDLPFAVRKLRHDNALLLIQIGILHPQKNQNISLQVVRELNFRYGIKTALILVGEGRYGKTLRETVKNLKLENQIYFAGFIPRNKLKGYYQIADLNLSPSEKESFTLAALEALASGKLSLISQDSGVLEVISDFAISTKIEVSEMSKKIADFYNRKNYFNNKLEEGRSYIKRKLSWEIFSSEFMAGSKKLLNKAIPPNIYNYKYFDIHHKKENENLKLERENKLNRAVNLLDLKPGMKVLDIGCGNGELSEIIAGKGCYVWGIDYSSDAVNLSKKRSEELPKDLSKKMKFIEMDATSLDFSDNYFDRIICVDVIEHIYSDTLSLLISEIKRVIKSEGLVIFETAPNSFLYTPFLRVAKFLTGIKKFESEDYHINIFNFFKLRKLLRSLSSDFSIDIIDEGFGSFSSRLRGVKNIPNYIVGVAKMFDFLREGPLSQRIIKSTFLKIFLSYDLWGVVKVRK
jgi:glycosyltransferase involved in cell wall biosynthesis/ubiquinone/menaquinone biosynthesis C-methylase UbiE